MTDDTRLREIIATPGQGPLVMELALALRVERLRALSRWTLIAESRPADGQWCLVRDHHGDVPLVGLWQLVGDWWKSAGGSWRSVRPTDLWTAVPDVLEVDR